MKKEKLIGFLYPLSFVLSYLLNITFFYLGQSVKGNAVREYGFIGGSICFAVIVGIVCLTCVKQKRFSKKMYIGGMIVLFFYACCYGIGIYSFGLSGVILDYLKQFICFSLPMFMIGACAAVYRCEDRFVSTIEKWSYFIVPAVVIYIGKAIYMGDAFFADRGLGVLNYMNVAYMIMPFMIAQMISFGDERVAEEKGKKGLLMRGLMIGLFWYAILATGTRGTYICVISVALVQCVLKWIRHKKVRYSLILFCVITFFLLVNLFVWTMPGLKAVSRMQLFIDGLANNELVTSDKEEEGVLNKVEEMVELGVSAGREEIVSGDQSYKMRDRGTMYKVALKEFWKEPIRGIGPMGYSIKYGTYPHNAVLELLCETGVVGAIPAVVLILTLLAKFFWTGRKVESVDGILLFYLAYALYANMSGSFWSCREVMSLFGFGIAFAFREPICYTKKNMSENQREEECYVEQ